MIKDEKTGKMRRKRPEERATESEEVPEEVTQEKPKARAATFRSVDVQGASLYWEDQFWSKMEVGVSIDVNTFVGHRWYVKIKKQGGRGKGEEADSPPPLLWQIADDGLEGSRQTFELRQSDLI